MATRSKSGSSRVELATAGDAAAIAAMSRDEIERGLGWSWNEARVRRAIRDPNTNVAVIRDNGNIAAFGIMSYREDAAHLLLFAVRRSQQRQGLGSTMLTGSKKSPGPRACNASMSNAGATMPQRAISTVSTAITSRS